MSPPLVPKKLLEWFTSYGEEFNAGNVLNDLYDHKHKTQGRRKAYFWYWKQVLLSIPKSQWANFRWSLIMLKNYFKIAFRNILRHKGYSLIHVFGLALGMACCLLISLWVRDELSFDRFHENLPDLYRVAADPLGAAEVHEMVTPGILAGMAKKEFPEVIRSVRLTRSGKTFLLNNDQFRERGSYADPDFFHMFTFPFLKGDPTTALDDPASIVISQTMAERYFGPDDPIGMTLTTNYDESFVVTGIIQDVPHNSHLQFDYIVQFSLLETYGTPIDNWTNVSFTTYFLLEKGASMQNVNQNLKTLVNTHDPDHNLYYLQPLKQVHLYSKFNFDFHNENQGDILYVRIFILVGIFILLIACINFINLATACSAKRAKEIGVRKVAGAQRAQLINQFLSETFLMILMALGLAFLIAFLALPTFYTLTGKSGEILNLNIPSILSIVGVVVLTGFLSGLYPAWILSSYIPTKVFRGWHRTRSGQASTLRNILVVFQFTLSIAMIIGTLVIKKQINHIQNSNLGFNKENLVYIGMTRNLHNNYETLKSRLLQYPDILNVTTSGYLPINIGSGTSSADWEGKTPGTRVQMQILPVDYDFFKTYQMTMSQGRFFSRAFTTDTSAVILNEAAINVMGLENPIGKRFTHAKDFHIIGVINNFHYKSLRHSVEPLIIKLRPDWDTFLSIRITNTNIPETIQLLKTVWEEYNPDRPFNYNFLDERLDRQYRAEQRMSVFFLYFAVLAVCISCLGLVGLATFTMAQQTKEIGIRKVLGASNSGLFLHLSRSFIKWVILANLFAWPLAWFIMNAWLQNFASQTSIGIYIFLISGFTALTIAIMTVARQSIKAARANPVDSLRYE